MARYSASETHFTLLSLNPKKSVQLQVTGAAVVSCLRLGCVMFVSRKESVTELFFFGIGYYYRTGGTLDPSGASAGHRGRLWGNADRRLRSGLRPSSRGGTNCDGEDGMGVDEGGGPNQWSANVWLFLIDM